MAPNTAKERASKTPGLYPHDPRRSLRNIQRNNYNTQRAVSTMADQLNSSMTIAKPVDQMTQSEILKALSDMGDADRRSGKHRKPPPGDPRTWKFDAKTQELMDAYQKFIPQEEVLADDQEHFETPTTAPHQQDSPDGHQPNRIEDLDEVVEADSSLTGAKRRAAIKKQKSRNKAKEQKKTLSIRTTPSETLDMSTPSPGTPKPWTAELDKSFANDPEVSTNYGLDTFTSAKAALRAPATLMTMDADDDMGISDNSAKPKSKSNHKGKGGSWTKEEQDHLVEVVTDCHRRGLRGEDLWSAAHPMMVARGVHRPLGGMRMMWLRGLRQETMLDERRRQNSAKMKTAIQKRKGVVEETDEEDESESGSESETEVAPKGLRRSRAASL